MTAGRAEARRLAASRPRNFTVSGAKPALAATAASPLPFSSAVNAGEAISRAQVRALGDQGLQPLQVAQHRLQRAGVERQFEQRLRIALTDLGLSEIVSHE